MRMPRLVRVGTALAEPDQWASSSVQNAHRLTGLGARGGGPDTSDSPNRLLLSLIEIAVKRQFLRIRTGVNTENKAVACPAPSSSSAPASPPSSLEAMPGCMSRSSTVAMIAEVLNAYECKRWPDGKVPDRKG